MWAIFILEMRGGQSKCYVTILNELFSRLAERVRKTDTIQNRFLNLESEKDAKEQIGEITKSSLVNYDCRPDPLKLAVSL